MSARAPKAAIRAILGQRTNQEDAALQTTITTEDGREALLLIVADGMGGAVAGEIASESAVDAFADYAAASDAPIATRLRGALDAANDAIAAQIAADRRLAGMGTTLVGVVVDGAEVSWISVGDSLLLSVEGTRIERLNADHSTGHLLRSALIGDPIPLIDTGSAVLAEKAWLVVATDGILTLDFAELARLVSGAESVEEAAEKVAQAVDALAAEYQDNMTIAVASPVA